LKYDFQFLYTLNHRYFQCFLKIKTLENKKIVIMVINDYYRTRSSTVCLCLQRAVFDIFYRTVTLIFDLLTPKSEMFISFPKCIIAVSLVKIRPILFKISSCQQCSGWPTGWGHYASGHSRSLHNTARMPSMIYSPPCNFMITPQWTARRCQ